MIGIQVTVIPRSGETRKETVYHPVKSSIFDAHFVGITAISVYVLKQKMTISFDGGFKCTFSGVSRILTMYIFSDYIDGQEDFQLGGDIATVFVVAKDDMPVLKVKQEIAASPYPKMRWTYGVTGVASCPYSTHN